jgi:hypothetical protein
MQARSLPERRSTSGTGQVLRQQSDEIWADRAVFRVGNSGGWDEGSVSGRRRLNGIPQWAQTGEQLVVERGPLAKTILSTCGATGRVLVDAEKPLS